VTSDSVDSEALVADARAEAARRRATGDYPADLPGRLDTQFTSTAPDFGSAPEALAHVPSGRALHADGLMGALTIPAKRIVRRMLAWYIHPITADQSRFNASITAELRSLERRVEKLEADASVEHKT
jgi:hypothetical protein